MKNEIRDMEAEASEILRNLENAKKETRMAKDLDREVDRQLKVIQNEVNSLETSLEGLDVTVAQGPDLASYVSVTFVKTVGQDFIKLNSLNYLYRLKMQKN